MLPIVLNALFIFCIRLDLYFDIVEINFQCLGDWIGHNGQRYMALLDVQDSATTAVTTTGGVGINGAERRPRYRCAVSYLVVFFFLFLVSLDRPIPDIFEFPSRSKL